MAAKATIEEILWPKSGHFYFAGCSDAGRKALMGAQCYPGDLNDVTAGALAMNFITKKTSCNGLNALRDPTKGCLSGRTALAMVFTLFL